MLSSLIKPHRFWQVAKSVFAQALPFFVLLIMLSCVETFEPPENTRTTDLLVVEGFVNGSDGSAEVKLSRTRALTDPNPSPTVPGAIVKIVLSTGEQYQLDEKDGGVYEIQQIAINKEATYTLSINTPSGDHFISDPINILETPGIDSITHQLSANEEALKVLVNTKDATEGTAYYSWTYSETYEYRVPYFSQFIFNKPDVIERDPNDRIDVCWRTENSTRIIIGTSTGNVDNALPQFPVTEIPVGSPKLSARYSILLHQRAVSQQEYLYLHELEKTTESLGTLFDPSPATVSGNIHQVNNTSQPVLGFFSGATIVSQRQFIRYEELPDQLKVPQVYEGCQVETTCDIRFPPLPLENCTRLETLSPISIILISSIGPYGDPQAYNFVPRRCADCRDHGGTLQKPDFW